MTRLRTGLAAIGIALVPLIIAACGSSSGSSFNAQQVVHKTFSNPKSIDSGNMDITLSAQGSQGSFDASITGPFQGSKDKTQLPQFDLTGKLSGSGSGTPALSFEGGLTVTANDAFVSYQGTAYKVPTALFDQFKTLYAQAAQQNSSSSGSASSFFDQLGIDPSKWVTNVKADGTSDIGGATTDHVTGEADIPKIVSDLKKITGAVPGASVNSSGLDQLQQQLKSATIDLYSGSDDHLLRKLAVSLDIAGSGGSSGGSVDFAITLNDVNKPQTISAPSNPQPVPRSILQQIKGLSALGSLGAGSTGGGLGGLAGGATGSSSSGGAIPGASGSSQKYVQCVLKASGDQAAINACASKYLLK